MMKQSYSFRQSHMKHEQVIIHKPFPLSLGFIRVENFYTIGADAHSEFSVQ